MLDKTLVSNPIELSVKFTKHAGQPILQLEYSKVIEFFMYAIRCTRTNIVFAVPKLSWYTSKSGTHHWMAIRRVLRYLKGTMDYGITYSGEPPIFEQLFRY